MPLYDNACKMCRYYLMAGKCLAFPGGIPDEVWRGENDHTKPVKGDGNIRFKPLQGAKDD